MRSFNETEAQRESLIFSSSPSHDTIELCRTIDDAVERILDALEGLADAIREAGEKK